MAARFAPVDLAADLTGLPDNERQALALLVKAARTFDALYLRQVWAGDECSATARPCHRPERTLHPPGSARRACS